MSICTALPWCQAKYSGGAIATHGSPSLIGQDINSRQLSLIVHSAQDFNRPLPSLIVQPLFLPLHAVVVLPRSGNPALRKSRRRAPPARVPRGVKRRQSVTERSGSPRRKRPQLQQGDARSHTALEAPDRHGSPAGAPLPMSRHALSYLQLTGAITLERASRIVVVSTPEGQRTPLPTRSLGQPPHEKGRDIPPGIARMLQQIRMPQARPQQLQPRREPRPNARTSRTAVLPTGPPMGFNVTSTPSPRLLSRPGQFSPSPAWSAPNNIGACMYEATEPAAAASKENLVDIKIVIMWARGEPRCCGLGVEPKLGNKDISKGKHCAHLCMCLCVCAYAFSECRFFLKAPSLHDFHLILA